MCVKTKLVLVILEYLKVIIQGRVAFVKAKETSAWNPDFIQEDDNLDQEVKEDFIPGKHDRYFDQVEVESRQDGSEVERVSKSVLGGEEIRKKVGKETVNN